MESSKSCRVGTLSTSLNVVADLHFSVGNGVCRDTLKVPCGGDTDTLALMGEALDAEKPDLVVSYRST